MQFYHSALRKTSRYKKVMSIHIKEILFLFNAYYMYTKSTEAPTVKIVKEFQENGSFKISSHMKLQGKFHYLLAIPPRDKKKDTAGTCKRSTKEKWKESRYEYFTCSDRPAFGIDPCFRMFYLNLHLILILSSFTVCSEIIDKPILNWLQKSINCYCTYYLLPVAPVLVQR